VSYVIKLKGRDMKIGFFGLLTLLFIGLKLGDVIAWSWLWVLAPMWIPWLIVIFFIMLMGLVSVITDRPLKVTRVKK
jgi:hypothetical protein